MERMIYKRFSLVVLLTVLQSGMCEDYLVALAYKGEDSYIRYIAGETGGLVEIQNPHFAYSTSRVLGPFEGDSDSVSGRMQITRAIENKAVVVSASDEDVNIVVNADGVFSPLPISALGTKYILPSSLVPNSSYRSLLLIATHNMSTSVDISFRMKKGSVYFVNNEYSDGDTLSNKLDPYQTFMVYTPHDLNGTVIKSEHSVAVYSGIDYASKYTVYDQLLPVKHHGQEYVVAVDDTKLELQIISEHSHVQITFSTGVTISTGERRLYNRSLEQGESLHFTTTRPVLVTLSRADGYSSVFTTVPPVHSYVTQRGYWPQSFATSLGYWSQENNLNTTLKILTERTATVLFKSDRPYNRLTWVDIPGSRYKVGTLVQSDRYTFRSTIISSDLPFTALSFFNGSVYNIGYRVSAVHYTDRSYLMALPGNTGHTDHDHIPRILASAGETGGQWQIQDPISGRVWSRNFNPYNTDYFYPISNRVMLFLVHVRDGSIHITGGMNFYTSFSALPVSALGTKYIMSSCLPPTGNIYEYTYLSVLVIATHSRKADVDVIFRLEGNVTYDGRTYNDGDTLSVRLDKYQAFSINSSSDMTRTIVDATETIAVYSGTYVMIRRVFETYAQLLPVKYYGSEYVLAINDSDDKRQGLSYQLQVVTDHSDTSIMFNNGSLVSMGKDGLYRKQCGSFDTFYFNTTRPASVTLCAAGTFYYTDGLIVVPPVTLYSTQTTQQVPGVMQILTFQENNNFQETHKVHSTVSSPPITWKKVSGTRFKVGTLSGGSYTTTIRSNYSFAVLGYHHFTIYNGGYNFRTYLDAATTTPDGIGNKLNTGGSLQETSTPDGRGNNLNTSVAFQATSTPDGIGNKLNTGGSLQADGSNNAALIVGIISGVVIVALLVAFMSYVFYIRKNTMPLKRVAEQGADAPSTSNIYTVPDSVAEGAADEATYTELTTNCTPVDVSIADSSATYVNFEGGK
ncbi:uncharacterized protein LOC124142513 isoform X1 [Haliotis rufescens]|uniref:uncharacterized protein LOC124142513 isoform X1 n=1 Tax=Haliotis rufescens TaxID=6454 RepID=UPI00201E8CF8|nr:uncharacterized protein LOC124142513 isoform X1 [Haliotis rufescens]XP_048244784.1 uncharacterized protein LOC124142513 isoform X1 [Haliotis rufescens]